MLEASKEYRAAITGDSRRMLLKAVIEIVDPDIVYGSHQSSGQARFSRPEQLQDRVMELIPYATLERNRWLLNGRFRTVPVAGAPGEIGMVNADLSQSDGTFATAQWVELRFSNVDILQACTLYFSTDAHDGIPVDFKVEVKQGGTAYYTKTVTGNTQSTLVFTGFTVYNADAIRVTATRWSLPRRRMRTVEIIPGLFEEWDGDIIASFDLKMQGDVSCLSLPYGTCTLRMDNADRRFEPRSKTGVFQSIEERQGIAVSIGPVLGSGTAEYKQAGIFYQYAGGWRTGDNGLTMQWDLVDIVGLIAGRTFLPPDTLPTTLGGWLGAIVAQLGDNFKDRWHADPDYTELPLVCAREDVTGVSCGDLLRWVCMATGTWPRADAETGDLTAEPLWNQGGELTLDNLEQYPVMRANEDLAAILFTLNDGEGTRYALSGNAPASSRTASVQNPFIKTPEEALTAARMIWAAYGGNKLETVGRGDPAGEIGDVDTVWLDESSATTGRRIQQTLSFQNGVLRGAKSVLLQADGAAMFQSRKVMTAGGSFTVPAGVTQLRLILADHGQDGTAGKSGDWDGPGEDGTDGLGGYVWAGLQSCTPGQVFTVSISDTGTTFGSHSSRDGQIYPYGYTDIAAGESYARTGVKKPLAGSGDGGKGGKGGIKGNRTRRSRTDKDGNTSYYWEVHNYPGPGQPGAKGATGCAVIYWDKEE